MASQIAYHPELKNPFLQFDWKRDELGRRVEAEPLFLARPFEAGQIAVIDGMPLDGLEYFVDHAGKRFEDWVPPVFSSAVQRAAHSGHPLWNYCQDESEFKEFQSQALRLQRDWGAKLQQLFPLYRFAETLYSYRLNHMDLGYLHLDIPPEPYEEQQLRFFINADTRPRILAVGPTIFELAEKYWDEKKLDRFTDLPPHQFVEAIRRETLDQTINKERGLPRHYLTLDPGAAWISHSSFISHGLVYGRKTICLETRIEPSSLHDQRRHFNTMLRELQTLHRNVTV